MAIYSIRYDNALLIMVYSSVFSITENYLYLDTAEKTTQYILSEMTFSVGGFYSAQDAYSKGVEEKYYTFKLRKIIDILESDLLKRIYRKMIVTNVISRKRLYAIYISFDRKWCCGIWKQIKDNISFFQRCNTMLIMI